MKGVVLVPTVRGPDWLAEVLPGLGPAELPLAGRRWIDYAVEWAEQAGYGMVEVLDWRFSEAVAADFADLTAHPIPVFYQRGEGELPGAVADLARQSSPLAPGAAAGDAEVDVVWGLELAGFRIDSVAAWHRASLDLLAGTGVSTLQAAMKVDGKPQVTDDLAAAGIVPVAGPTSSNGAATVPIDSYLQLNHNLSGSQQYYTLMMDIRPKSLAGYNALLQTSALNNDDADIFLNKTHIGINTSGLGYGGEVVEGKWHRIVLSVFENCMSAYIDGKMAVTTFTSNTRWALPEVAYLFCDEDGEEGTVDIAELRFWDAALTGKHIKELGVVNVEDAIELTKETPAASSNGLYDMQGRKILEGTKLQKGIYIMGGKKIMIK